MSPTVVMHTQLSPFDLIPPKVYIKFVLYLPLTYGVKSGLVYQNLQAGLAKTFEEIPFLSGKVFLRPPKSQGWRPGQLEIRHTEPWHAEEKFTDPRQLVRKDLTPELVYEDLKDGGFPYETFEDDLVISAPFIPDVAKGCDVFIAQANFVQGGCLLAGAIHHSVADGTGMMLLMQAWAANCKAICALTTLDGANSKAPNMNPSLTAATYDRQQLERIWRQESPERKAVDVDPKIWALLGLDQPTSQVVLAAPSRLLKIAWFHILELLPSLYSFYAALIWVVIALQHPALRKPITLNGHPTRNEAQSKSSEMNGTITEVLSEASSEAKILIGDEGQAKGLLKAEDPATPLNRRSEMESSIFYMTAKKFAQLKTDLNGTGKSASLGDTISFNNVNNESISANDALLALFWRALMKARVKAKYATPHSPNEQALLQSPIDGRSDFSGKVSRLYVGNVVLVNQVYMPVSELTAPSTSLHDVALRIRQGALKVTQRSVQDAFTLARDISDYTAIKHAFTSLEGSAMMITSLVALPFEKFDFGDRFFRNGGKPEALRPLMGGFNRAFRLCVILPSKSHGGLELLVSLFEDEMEILMKDEEFTKYAAFLCH